MLDNLLTSVFGATGEATTMATVSMSSFLVCSAASLALGLAIGLVYMFKNKTSNNFVVAIALLPIIVQVVILLVNGNLGVGVAVMGVFSLVRFRSMPGTARDIATVFEAMGVGLATGMGYIGLAALLVVIVSAASIAYAVSPLNGNAPGGKAGKARKQLRITVPEDIEFDTAFDEVLSEYCESSELSSVETVNMGSMFQLKYDVVLKDISKVKQMIDALRCLNGNLKISLVMAPTAKKEL